MASLDCHASKERLTVQDVCRQHLDRVLFLSTWALRCPDPVKRVWLATCLRVPLRLTAVEATFDISAGEGDVCAENRDQALERCLVVAIGIVVQSGACATVKPVVIPNVVKLRLFRRHHRWTLKEIQLAHLAKMW